MGVFWTKNLESVADFCDVNKVMKDIFEYKHEEQMFDSELFSGANRKRPDDANVTCPVEVLILLLALKVSVLLEICKVLDGNR